MKTENDGAFRGSAVMPVGSCIDHDELLGELELRLMRCNGTNSSHRGTLRRGGILAAGEHACAVARGETRAFWHAHRLEKASKQVLNDFVDNLFLRPPRYLAWAITPVFTELAESLLSEEIVPRLVLWLTTGEPVERVVRDTIALTVVVKWVEQLPHEVAIGKLAVWCNSSVMERSRLGFVALASWLQRGTGLTPRVLDGAYAACFGSARRQEVDIAMAVGWALRELLLRDGVRLIPRFERQVDCLTRHTFRTAVERLPADARLRLSKRWLECRRNDTEMQATLPLSRPAS